MDDLLQSLLGKEGASGPHLTRPIPPCPNGGRRLVISDIHGCHKTFSALLKKVQLNRNDQLFLLGDYISRGPNSGKVIDIILDLRYHGFDVFALRGNHEQMVLDCLENTPFRLPGILERFEAHGLLKDGRKLKKKYEQFFNGLYYYFELENAILVHAGLNFEAKDPLEDHNAMLKIRNFSPNKKWLKKKRIVHGHSRHTIDEIREAYYKKARVMPIDNGCANTKNIQGHGRLICLDLTNWDLIGQKNLDFESANRLKAAM